MCLSSSLEIRPAVASDLRALAGGHLLTRAHGRAFALQLGAEAWTMVVRQTHHDAGVPIAAAGFWPANGYREVWLMVTPSLRAKSVYRAALLAIDEQLQALFDPALPTVAAVDGNNRGGRAIAARLGFVDAGPHPLYPGAVMFVLAR